MQHSMRGYRTCTDKDGAAVRSVLRNSRTDSQVWTTSAMDSPSHAKTRLTKMDTFRTAAIRACCSTPLVAITKGCQAAAAPGVCPAAPITEWRTISHTTVCAHCDHLGKRDHCGRARTRADLATATNASRRKAP